MTASLGTIEVERARTRALGLRTNSGGAPHAVCVEN
jgi:hypothetical protein